MRKHPDFEGALADIFNGYELVDSHLMLDADFRADFARHVARQLRRMGIGLHHIAEPDAVVMERDADLGKADAFIAGLLQPT